MNIGVTEKDEFFRGRNVSLPTLYEKKNQNKTKKQSNSNNNRD